jgi:hypothetical protein
MGWLIRYFTTRVRGAKPCVASNLSETSLGIRSFEVGIKQPVVLSRVGVYEVPAN